MPGDVLLGLHRVTLAPRMTSTTLAVAMTDAIGTAATLTSGTALANVTAALPGRIEVDNERMYVTAAAGAVMTVVRGRDGTTATTHSIGATVKILMPIQLEKAADWTPAADIQDIAIPGDGSVEHVFRLQGLSGTMTVNRWQNTMLKDAMGVTELTTGIHSDMTTQMHPELGTYPLTEMWVDLVALDGDNNNATIYKRVIVWANQVQNPFVMGAAGNNDLQGTPLNWSAQPVTLDLFGRAIAGATTAVRYSVGDIV